MVWIIVGVTCAVLCWLWLGTLAYNKSKLKELRKFDRKWFVAIEEMKDVSGMPNKTDAQKKAKEVAVKNSLKKIEELVYDKDL